VQVIRRLSLYVLSAVTLAVLAVGLRLVVGVLLDTLLPAGDPLTGGTGSREQLSLAGALIGVGLPVWAIHWGLIRRSLRTGEPDADEERGSAVRAIYLTAVLAVAAVFAVNAAIDLVASLLRAVLGATGADSWQPDLAGLIATLVIAGAAWAYHAAVRRSDMAAGPLADAAAWWPRVYLYGAMLVSLYGGIEAIRRLIDELARIVLQGPAAFGTSFDAVVVAGQLAALVVLGAAFVTHAWYAERLLADPGWRGASERPARVRVAFFVAVLAIGTTIILSDLVAAGRAVIAELLGADPELVGDRSPTLAQGVLVPLLSLLPWLIAVLAVRRRALDEAERCGLPGRAMAVARLEEYLLSLIGLAAGGIALGWLLGLALDTLLGGTRVAFAGSGWKYEVASFLPAAIVGLGLWAWRWSWVTVRWSTNPVAEAASGIRRTALLIALAVSLIAGVISLALILYRLFGSFLGISFGDSVVSALSTPAGALIVATAVALYQGLLVRRDGRVRAGMAASQAAAGEPAATRHLVLHAPSPAALDATLAAIRSSLPPGTRLDDA